MHYYRFWSSPWLWTLRFIAWLGFMALALYVESRFASDRVLVWLLHGVLWLYVAATVLSALMRLTLARTAYGTQLLPQMAATLRASSGYARAQLEKMRIVVSSALSLVALTTYSTTAFQAALPFAAFFGAASLTYLLRISLPPLVAYFASSRPERLDVLERLQRRVLGTVGAMLDIQGSVGASDQTTVIFRRLLLVQFDLRRENDGEWKAEAARLMNDTPLLILDSRDTSDAVMYEVAEILRLGYQQKTIFLSEPDGRCPALSLLLERNPNAPRNLHRLSEREMMSSLKALTMDPKNYRDGFRFDAGA